MVAARLNKQFQTFSLPLINQQAGGFSPGLQFGGQSEVTGKISSSGRKMLLTKIAGPARCCCRAAEGNSANTRRTWA